MPESEGHFKSENMSVLSKENGVLHKVQGVHLSLGIRGKPNNLEEPPERGAARAGVK